MLMPDLGTGKSSLQADGYAERGPDPGTPTAKHRSAIVAPCSSTFGQARQLSGLGLTHCWQQQDRVATHYSIRSLADGLNASLQLGILS